MSGNSHYLCGRWGDKGGGSDGQIMWHDNHIFTRQHLVTFNAREFAEGDAKGGNLMLRET